MSLIIAAKLDNELVIAFDSLSISGTSAFTLPISDAKVFQRDFNEVNGIDKVTIGVVGNQSINNMLRNFSFSVEANYYYSFESWLYQWLKLLKVEAGDKKLDNFLIVADDTIYKIWSDFCYTKHEDWIAIGSGRQTAEGRIFRNDINKYILKYALEAAEYFNNNVRRPFYLLRHSTGEVEEL